MSVRLVIPPNAPQAQYKRFHRAWIASLRDRIEYESSLFLLVHRQRILGREFNGSCTQLLRRRMLIVIFEKLEKVYLARVTILLGLNARIEWLRRSIHAMNRRRSTRKIQLGINLSIKGYFEELQFRNAEEQDLLEGIQEVEQLIAQLNETRLGTALAADTVQWYCLS